MKKYFGLLILIILSTISYAEPVDTSQDCRTFVGYTQTGDGQNVWVGKEAVSVPSTSNQAAMTIVSLKYFDYDEIHLALSLTPDFCFETAHRVIFNFKDGSKVNFASNNQSNCTGVVSFGFGLNDLPYTEFYHFVHKDLDSIQFEINRVTNTFKIPPKQARIVRNTSECLVQL
jgi:hypothetical protein